MNRTVSTVTTPRASEAHQHRCAVLQCLRDAGTPLLIAHISEATRLTPEEIAVAARVLLLESIIDSPHRGCLSFPAAVTDDATEWSLAA